MTILLNQSVFLDNLTEFRRISAIYYYRRAAFSVQEYLARIVGASLLGFINTTVSDAVSDSAQFTDHLRNKWRLTK